ncbi:MAG: hypothetical protein K0R62_2016 [Nonomuraea muscovyensis]|nr:hypothetical protein [Nonomuraea muscovyensis]
MNPWREVLAHIEAGDNAGLVEFVGSLGDVGRRAVAVQLPGHLAERLAEGWEARWETRDRAAGYRIAGAACLSGAGQVAAWLNRRELRDAAGRTDAERILRLLRQRPEEWRRDLAVRLVERLRLPRGRAAWRWTGGLPGWHLAAGLVLQTGVEPPANDAFTAGWVLRMAAEREVPRADDPLLDLMVARLFQATGAAAGLAWSQSWNSGHDIVTALVTLAGDGRLKRQDLLDGCLTRFLSGAAADELAPFVAMWRQLTAGVEEIPVLEFTRLLPSAPSLPAQLALDELRRADQAGLLDDELFGEAVRALAYRPERKHVTAALRWIADAVPGPGDSRARAGNALVALATVFSHDAPAVRDRAVRLALNLGAHHTPTPTPTPTSTSISSPPPSSISSPTSTATPTPSPTTGPGPERAADPARAPGRTRETDAARAAGIAPADCLTQGWDAVREAAAALPDDLRSRVATVFGEVEALTEEPVAAPVPVARPLPALLPPIETPGELADELSRLPWADDPALFERVVAALVTFTHRDRDAVVEALRPWWRSEWRQPFDTHALVYGVSGFDRDARSLLRRCALAVVSPGDSRELTAGLDAYALTHPPHDPPLHHLLQRRLREVIALFEREGTVPVLLATPTSPTGHVDPETLLARLELLDGAEPLPADLDQALLRLPRLTTPALAVRADGIGTEAGRRLAGWLRAGGLPDPDVTCVIKSTRTFSYGETRSPQVRVSPVTAVPEGLAGVLAVGGHTSYPQDAVWWPWAMPSHREVVAAHLLAPLIAYGGDGGLDEALADLVHGDGPLGVATATALTTVMGYRRPERRAAATHALVTLAARDEPDGAGFGRLLGRVVGEAVLKGLVKLNRVMTVLNEATESGAGTWPVLASALEVLLPAPGAKPTAALGDLLATAVRSAVLSGARGDVPGLAALAARKGASRTGEEARRLHHHLTRA